MCLYSLTALAAVILPSSAVFAQDHHNHSAAAAHKPAHTHNHLRADGHAPIGVMGDHMHPKGGFMFSYRYMRMDMDGHRIGTNDISLEEIVTTVPNQNPIVAPNGMTVTPPFLRVVPTKMTMDMHMFGVMYAPTNNITLMAMLPLVRKEMDHITFQAPNPMMGVPPNNTNRIGGFATKSEGVGDLKLSSLIRLYDDRVHHIHANLGISAPTGSTKERDTILDPFVRTPTIRLPYAMQLGTGTWDLLPGITYTGRAGDLSWGAQYRAEIRLENENDKGYAWGDKHLVTAWAAYQFAPWISASVRANYMHQTEIDGFDPQIGGPVQTAHPEFYGGERLHLLGGINLVGQEGVLRGHRLAIEAGVPVFQDLNGPQMKTDWTLMVGWQKAF